MAVSSLPANLIHSLPFPNYSPSPILKPKTSSSSLVSANCPLNLRTIRLSPLSSRVHVLAAEALESQISLEASPETLDGSGFENVGMAPKQKIRIKLMSYWVPLS